MGLEPSPRVISAQEFVQIKFLLPLFRSSHFRFSAPFLSPLSRSYSTDLIAASFILRHVFSQHGGWLLGTQYRTARNSLFRLVVVRVNTMPRDDQPMCAINREISRGFHASNAIAEMRLEFLIHDPRARCDCSIVEIC